MSQVVVEHKHNKEDGVFVLVVADEVWEEIERWEPDEDHDYDASGETEPQGKMVKENVLAGYTNHEDFVFHASDEMWVGRPMEDIAKDQREVVAKALKKRNRKKKETEQEIVSMPGEGEEL